MTGLCLPQDEASSWTREARRGVHLHMRLAKPHGVKRLQCVRAHTHTHIHRHTQSLSHFTLEKILSPRDSNLYSSRGSGKSQKLLFSERAVCLNIVCVQ